MSNDFILSDRPVGESPTRTGRADETLQLRDIIGLSWHLFKRYFWIFILTCALAGAAVYYWTKEQPFVYQTNAKLLFPQNTKNVFGRQIERVEFIDSGGRYPIQFEHFWNTQREILTSKDFALRVVRRGDFLARPGLIPTEGPDGKSLSEEERLKSAGGIVRAMTNVRLQPDTRVVIVTTTSTDAELARDVANAYAQAYVDYTRDYQSGGLNQMVTWFDNYVASKRDELSVAQKKLHEFKKDKGILSISYEDRQSLTGSNMLAINAQLNEVKAKLASEEALIAQIEKMQKQGEDLRALGELISAEGLRALISREELLRERLAQLKGRGYLEENREIKAVTSELEVVEEHIRKEIERIRSGAKNRAAALRRERNRLNSELTSLKKEAFELDALGAQYSGLKDDSENLKELFRAVLKRSEELDINSMYESDIVQVLELAIKPSAPISPNLPRNLAMGILVGLLLGGGIIALLYFMDNTVRAESDISKYTSKPVLGMLPEVDRALLKTMANASGGAPNIELITHVAPKSTFAEGVKVLRTNLMFISPDQPPELLLVTSPGPGEGKTLISCNMAVAMAQSGLRTVIIDGDMRRPRMHKVFGVENGEHGTSSLILGTSTLEEAVRETEVENLSMISCGPIPPNPSELLHTKGFAELVEELRANFDRIILDTPPLGAVSDALIPCRVVDGVVLVVKFGGTRRDLLRRSIEQLETVGAPFTGTILNKIDTSAAGGYGYSYYYYRYNYDSPTTGGSRPNKRGAA